MPNQFDLLNGMHNVANVDKWSPLTKKVNYSFLPQEISVRC